VTPSAYAWTEAIPINFEGPGSGSAPMTWGQREIWAACEVQGRTLAMGGAMASPSGSTVDDVAAVLRFAISRHQALRTRFRCDDGGRPVEQVVAGHGEVTLDVFDVAGDADPAAFAAALRWEYEDRPFDLAGDWPIRMGVVRQGGVPAFAVVMYSHLVLDGFGLDALTRDMANLGRPAGEQAVPAPDSQPLGQAAHQGSPAGQRQSESALRYWERLLRTVGPRRSRSGEPIVPDHGQARYWQAGLRSPAMHLALTGIAARTQLDTSPVLLAAFAVSLARVSGVNPSLVRTVVSNRFRPDFAESVSVVNQTGLCVIDVADAGFDEVAQRTWRATVGAGMHAYYDPQALARLVDGLSREGGERLDLACFFNDARRTRQAEAAPTGADLAQALPRTVFRWIPPQEQPTERLYLFVHEAVDTVDLVLAGDTWYWPPDQLESCARGMEAVLVAAAFDPDASTGVGRVGADGLRSG
jgi:Condensation domain